ncbi:MAG: flagellin [Candidatus Calescibacterium sp.]|nr:flagellin [Candidatus Calescibacterium sp.]
MRVPTRFVFETRKEDIAKNQTSVLELQKRISSGIRILKPSDSPSEYSTSRSIEIRISKLSRDISDANEVLHFLRAKEDVLDKISNILAKAKLHAERGLDSSTNEEFGSLASAVEELFNQAVELSNTSVRGRFIFGGSRTVPIGTSYRKPYYDNEVEKQESWESQKGITGKIEETLKIKEGRFKILVYDNLGNQIFSTEVQYLGSDTISDVANKINTAGGGLVLASTSSDGKLRVFSPNPGFKFSIVQDNMGLISELGGDGIPEYQGNGSNLSIEVQSALVEITSDGREIFGDIKEGKGGVLTTLKDLIDILRFRREGNTQDLLRSAVLEIEKTYELVSSLRAKIGEKINFIEKRFDLLSNIKAEETIRKSEIEDIDMPQASVELTLKESVLQASMISAVRAFELTILRFL